MTEDSLIGKVIMILNKSDIYIGRLENKKPLTLEAPYLLIKQDADKMAIVPHTTNPITLEGKIDFYNESNLRKKMRFLCYSPKDESVLKKMIDAVYV
jgi:hypothetical protein